MTHAAKFGSEAFDFQESLGVSSHIDPGGGVVRGNAALFLLHINTLDTEYHPKRH